MATSDSGIPEPASSAPNFLLHEAFHADPLEGAATPPVDVVVVRGFLAFFCASRVDSLGAGTPPVLDTGALVLGAGALTPPVLVADGVGASFFLAVGFGAGVGCCVGVAAGTGEYEVGAAADGGVAATGDGRPPPPTTATFDPAVPGAAAAGVAAGADGGAYVGWLTEPAGVVLEQHPVTRYPLQ